MNTGKTQTVVELLLCVVIAIILATMLTSCAPPGAPLTKKQVQKAIVGAIDEAKP